MPPATTFKLNQHWKQLLLACSLVLSVVASIGCHHFWPKNFGPPPPVTVPVSNPAHVGAVDPTFLWQQIVDTVDDYFRIASEAPARRENDTWLEGRLRTYPEVSATSFEPWRRDVTRGFERIQSTFLTVRRTAVVRVVPEATGYLIDVNVLKEQEDIDNPQFATASNPSQQQDVASDAIAGLAMPDQSTLGWYEIGRDRELEQRIMENILGRITDVEEPKHKRR
ncbi:MAG: hypothetical protein SFV81_25280 [Pirellulaceae bacterium]|nr:hypothetical protein [Pirellulaceae bacterium]